MLYSFENAYKSTKKAPQCPCSTGKYIVPSPHHIPRPLANLQWEGDCVLSPFVIDCERFVMKEHGYRQKTGLINLKWSPEFVIDKINDLADDNQRLRCSNAYEFLMSSNESSYKDYIDKQRIAVLHDNQPSIFETFQWCGIECALWPSLYPFTEWCESAVEGTTSRESSKASFLVKCFSPMLDYSLHFELLQFVFERWLYKTITGALNSAKAVADPMSQHYAFSAFHNKPFSTGYWKWQHLYLLDALQQFGAPSLFLTISPSEASFTKPLWMEFIEEDHNLPLRGLPFLQTMHYLHILEQVVRGYLCGSNDSRWSSHIFNDDFKPKPDNVLTYFYRFEFQKRGTIHLHLLVWLKDVAAIQYPHLSASLPSEESPLLPYVTKFQRSNKSSLPIFDEPTSILENGNRKHLLISHSAEAFHLGLRGYIDTLLPALQCSMDVQATDGKSMLLKYVSSYVTKWKESYHSENLEVATISPSTAAFKYLASMDICEPEM